MNLRLAVLGDSIAYGVGADRHSHTLAERLRAALAQHDIDLEPHVFAVPGARSAGLAGQVRRALAWQPHVAVTVIGANDLTHLVPHDQAARHLRDAVRTLRGRHVEVVVAPAPDLSIVPNVPVMMRPVVHAGSLALRSAQIRAVHEEGGLVADSTAETSVAFLRDRSLFSSDRFHPSSRGYALIAGALAPAVLGAARAATSRAAQTEQTA
jgi:lysophospholipase L1-like esterase